VAERAEVVAVVTETEICGIEEAARKNYHYWLVASHMWGRGGEREVKYVTTAHPSLRDPRQVSEFAKVFVWQLR